MLDYEWGNPSAIYLSGEEPTQDSNQTHQIFDQYNQNLPENFFPHTDTTFSPHHSFQQQQTHIQTLYDSHTYSFSYPPPPPETLPPESISSVSSGFMMIPKREDVYGRGGLEFQARIGLNLGGRTYFSSSEDDFVNRLYRRTRPLEAGPSNSPRCQAEGCNVDLTHAKHYHRRHKVCEFHSKASTVITAGLTQRFCQQCSRFHLLTEFDQGKRSCRKRLADHNRRRRKSQPHHQQQQQHQHQQQQTQLENARDSPPENPARSSSDSGAHSSSSVTVAVSPPRMTLGGFWPKHQHQASASSSSSGSLFSHISNFRPYDRLIPSLSWDGEEQQ